MKKSIILFAVLISIFSLSILFFGCVGQDKPKVTSENTYEEKNNEGNEKYSTPENTNLKINGNDWIKVKGTYSSAEDHDNFLIEVNPDVFKGDTSYKIEMVPCSEGKALGKLMSMGFPANAKSYNQNDSLISMHNLISVSSGFEIMPGTSHFIIQTHGRESEGSEKSIYTEGKSYSIILK